MPIRFTTDSDNGKRLIFTELLTSHWMLVQWDWRREPFRPALHGEQALNVIAYPSGYAHELAGAMLDA